MTILQPDVNLTICIQSMQDDVVFWRENHSFSDSTLAKGYVNNWLKQYGKSIPGLGILEGVVVTRIDSLENFAKDFFLPTVVNLAFKIESIVGRIFACFFAVVLDIISFPIRFIALPIRAVYNVPEPAHPLEELIRTNGTPTQELITTYHKEGIVRLQCKIQQSNYTLDEYLGLIKKQKTKQVSQKIFLKRLPGGSVSFVNKESFTESFQKKNDTWESLGVSKISKSSSLSLSF